MSERRTPHRAVATFGVLTVAIVITGLVLGCSLVPRASSEATAGEPHENMPAFASVWLTAEPPVARDGMAVELRSADGDFSQSETFQSGEVIRTSFGVSSGAYRLIGPDGVCAADIVLAPERESDAILRLDQEGGCSLAIVRQHGDEFAHEASGMLTAQVTAAPGGTLLVEVVSLDTPLNPVPDPVPPDEGRLAIVEPLWPGRYQVRLLRDAQVVETIEITIAKREPAGDLVQLTLDGRPD